MRPVQSLNGNWFFRPDPHDIHHGPWGEWYRRQPRQDYLKHIAAFKDIGWWNIPVPGNWETAFPKLAYYEGTGWYLKEFDIDVSMKNKNIFLRFEGVSNESEVWLNDEHLGKHTGAYTPFEFDVTSLIKNKNNLLAVKVNNEQKPDSTIPLAGWRNYGGIYRDVYLYALKKVKIDWQAVFTEKLTASGARLKILHHLLNLDRDSLDKALLETEIISPEGSRLKKIVKELSLKKYPVAHSFSISLDDVKKWTPDTPHLYRVISRVRNIRREKEIFDEASDSFGIRIVGTHKGKVYLNGEPVFIKGINKHDLHPSYGMAAPENIYEKDLRSIRKMGFNTVRLAHYPHSAKEIAIADKIGLMLFGEAPVLWGVDFGIKKVKDSALQQVKEMIKRDINHPSIILWSLGNEIKFKNREETEKYLRKAHKITKQLDPHRMISFDGNSFNGKDGKEIYELMDTVNIHNYPGWYGRRPEQMTEYIRETYRSFPAHPVMVTEFGVGAERGFRSRKNEIWSEEYQLRTVRKIIECVKKSRCAGFCLWVFADFHDPTRNANIRQCNSKGEVFNRKGIVDEFRKPKLLAEEMKKILEN